MESGKCVGRIGALAVALGIGTALTTGTGIAWADDAGGSASSAGSSDASSGSSAGGSATTTSGTDTTESSGDTKSTPSRQGPLSTLGERLRARAEASADAATERAQSRLERMQSRLEAKSEKVQADIADTDDNPATEAVESTEPVRRPTSDPGTRPGSRRAVQAARTTKASAEPHGSTGDSDATPAGPAAADTVPELTRPKPTKPVTFTFSDIGQTVARGVATLTGSGAATTDSLPAAPATAFVVPAATQASISGASLVSALLVGLPLAAGSGPAGGAPSAALWALAAWARRESDQALTPNGTALQSVTEAQSPAAADVALLAAAVPGTVVVGPGQTAAPVIDGSTSSTQTGWTTGNGSGVGVTDKWYVGGTDLGIMWDSGIKDAQGKPVIFTLFGDTYDVADPGSNIGWRDNVLLRANDFNLNNGLQFADALIHDGGNPNKPMWWRPVPGLARAGAAQIIDPAYIDQLRRTNTYTLIPTAAIAGNPVTDAAGNPVLDADGNPLVTQYATVMSIKQWGQPGSWTTNWSAIAVSADNGKSWTIDPDTVRAAATDKIFQQNAMIYGNPADAASYVDGNLDGERYVYVYGTPAGRQGSAYVARVPESQLTNLAAYEYFAGNNADTTGNWVVAKPSEAIAVIGAQGATGSIFPESGILGFILKPFVSFLKFIYPAGFRPGGIFSASGSSGNVSEMSVQYNEALDQYIVLYTDGGNNVVMRVSDSPQGTWSNSTVLRGNQGFGQNTGMYAPMIHPLSGTGQLEGDNNGAYLYYNLSQWNDYNVRMMRADLGSLRIT